MVNYMNNKINKYLAFMLMTIPLCSYADAGRVCFETDNPILGGASVLADFRVSFKYAGQEVGTVEP
jgi:hypothetical protein